MTDLFLLSQAQMRRIERHFSRSHGIERVDDGRIVSAIEFIQQDFRRVGARGRQGPPPGPNSKLHVVCDGRGLSLVTLLSEGQMSDYKSAALALAAMPRPSSSGPTRATTPMGSRSSPSGTSQSAFLRNPTKSAIPYDALPYDALPYEQRHKIENMFGRLKA
jgi:transposase